MPKTYEPNETTTTPRELTPFEKIELRRQERKVLRVIIEETDTLVKGLSLVDEMQALGSDRDRVEDLIDKLKESYTIIIVTHNMQQASRVSDKTAFFFEGELIEFNDTETIFTNPTVQQTENYITGRFG